MKNKISPFIALSLFSAFLISCSNEPPKCGDAKTKSLVIEIITDKYINLNLLNGAITSTLYSIKNITKSEIQSSMHLEFPRASHYQENIKNYDCEASIVVGDSKNNPISFTTQLDDKNEHIVSVSGIDNYLISLIPNIVSEIKKVRKAAREAPKSTLPSNADAISDLFDTNTDKEEIVSSEGEITNVWFRQSFKNNGENIHVVFIKTLTPKSYPPNVLMCSSCSVSVGAITYKQISGLWQIVSKNINFGSVGGYGDAPEANEVKTFKLSEKLSGFSVPYSEMVSGESWKGTYLLMFADNSWKNAGLIILGAGNYEQCHEESPLEKHSCWGHDGAISVIADKNKVYPDILVTRKGTDFSEEGTIISAKNIVYTFDGKQYSQTKEGDSNNSFKPLQAIQDIKIENSINSEKSKTPTPQIYQPSFDCKKASTIPEKLICSNQELAEADLKLYAAYKIAKNSTDDKAAFINAGNKWRKYERDICLDVDCLKKAYQNRLQQLTH